MLLKLDGLLPLTLKGMKSTNREEGNRPATLKAIGLNPGVHRALIISNKYG